MEILNVTFERPFLITKDGKKVQLVLYRTPEPGNIKMGIDAPRDITVDREEIAIAKRMLLERMKSCS